MTQEEFSEWIERVGQILRGVAVFTAFIGACMVSGYFVTKMEQSEMKKSVPDCGSCRLYKQGEKK
jgi:hypothetical protein